jgi:16S rRNA (uracil1498-N3)-methyltransferase
VAGVGRSGSEEAQGFPEGARAAAAHVFVDDIAAPVLGGDDRHHLERVLRLRAGESISVADGRGAWRLCAYTGSSRTGGAVSGPLGVDGLEPVGEVLRPPRPVTEVTVGFALTKGDRPEWAVQKLTEIGVDRIVPLVTARSVVRWDGDRAGRHLSRLREVARQAAMQSRQLCLPSIDDVRSPADVVAALMRSSDRPAGAAAGGMVGPAGTAEGIGRAAVALAVPGGDRPSLACPVVLVGPEGGWSLEEEVAAPATIGLGPTVLRTETAAVVAAAYLCALRAAILSVSP